jgi:hypothetical protein
MRLVMPEDVLDLAKAWVLNAELVRKQMEGFKPRAGSSKALPKKAPVNITPEVWLEEKR